MTEFQTIADVSLEASGVAADMQSVEVGPVEAAAGTLTEIVTVVPGWETVTNAEAAVQGRLAQGDPEYRLTYRARTARNAIGPLSALDGRNRRITGWQTPSDRESAGHCAGRSGMDSPDTPRVGGCRVG